jgi:2-oxoacid:acceptor oxidoreductase gamma subunit (pyruvate/2-ketoisovalerate family)
MEEIVFHGRGGQGVVTSAELLGRAVVVEGKHAQSFPFFGPERRGAPVVSFVRIDDQPIRTKEQIYEPSHIVVLDSAIFQSVDNRQGFDPFTLFSMGLKPNGKLLINTTDTLEKITNRLKTNLKLYVVDSTSIAMEYVKKSIVSIVILGALAKAFGFITLDSLKEVIFKKFPNKLGEMNWKGAKVAYESVVCEE